jgi:hypothetical protein
MMYCYLYEALDDNGQPCFLFDAANEDALHAQLRALPDPDKTKWTARFYRRLYADTPEEMDALKLEIEDKWVRETSPETESRATQGGVPSAARSDGVSETRMSRNDHDSESPSSHSRGASPERSPYVAHAQERVTGGTVTHAKATYIYDNGVKRGGRPVRGLKSPVPPAFLLYYRPGEGFKEDLDLILAKTGIGPAGLARALGVSRRRIHAWRADGMPQSMDPLVFWQVLWWAYLLRGKRYGWQR